MPKRGMCQGIASIIVDHMCQGDKSVAFFKRKKPVIYILAYPDALKITFTTY